MKSASFAAAAAVALLVEAAAAQEVTTLRFAVTSPQTSPTWRMQWEPWTQRVEKDADGALKIQVYFGGTLATMANAYDRLINGVADMSYAIYAVVRGKFPKTSVVELPLDVNGRDGSVAMWRLYESGLLAQEHADVHPLGIFVYPQTIIHFHQPVRKLEELQGMKIGAGSKVAADVLTRLGVAPVTVTPPELYEVLQRRVVDGVAIAWTGVLQYKVAEVTNYHLNYAFGSTGGWMFMNKASYGKLTGKAKAAIDKNSGLGLSREFGMVLDRIATEQHETVGKMPGHTIARLEPAEQARWDKLVEPVIGAWIAETPDGAKIWEAYKAEVQKARMSNR